MEFFRRNDSFGDIFFVMQGQMATSRNDGKFITEMRNKMAMHPYGQSGAWKALGRSALLAMMIDSFLTGNLVFCACHLRIHSLDIQFPKQSKDCSDSEVAW
jgi:hypothetical protein